MNKTKLKKLVDGLSSFEDEVRDSLSGVDTAMADFLLKLKEDMVGKTVIHVDDKLRILESRFRAIVEAVEGLRYSFETREKEFIEELKSVLRELKEDDHLTAQQVKDAIRRIEQVNRTQEKVHGMLVQNTDKFQKELLSLEKDLRNELDKGLRAIEDIEIPNLKFLEERANNLEKELKEVFSKLRADLLSLVSHQTGGGNANRNILVAGNPSVLGRYTDLNLKPGSNVTLSYVNNDNLKTTDLTIAATGGAGISRSISIVSVSSVLSDTASTDIVIAANAGIQLTLPTAVSNTNLYTIKNVGTSSVLVGTTGGQTIDTDTTLIMPVQFTSVDIISDNANWQIT